MFWSVLRPAVLLSPSGQSSPSVSDNLTAKEIRKSISDLQRGSRGLLRVLRHEVGSAEDVALLFYFFSFLVISSLFNYILSMKRFGQKLSLNKCDCWLEEGFEHVGAGSGPSVAG